MLLGYDEQRLEHSPDPVSKRTTRFNASVVEGEVRMGAVVHPIHAAAGALIIFEISSVHRGMPCEGGERAVLTNYYRVKRPSTTCSDMHTVGRSTARETCLGLSTDSVVQSPGSEK